MEETSILGIKYGPLQIKVRTNRSTLRIPVLVEDKWSQKAYRGYLRGESALSTAYRHHKYHVITLTLTSTLKNY